MPSRPSVHEVRELLLRAVPWLSLTASAFFVAKGLSAMAEAALIPEPAVLLGKGPLASGPPARMPSARNGDAILARNPFDSKTGPLNRSASPVVVPQPVEPTDPLSVPRCEAIYVLSIADSSDPTWSSAIVQGPGEPHGIFRRAGDQVAGRKLVYIGYNPVESSPAVWFADAVSLCQAVLFGDAPRSRAPQPPSPPPKPGPPTAPNSRPTATPVPPAIASKIKRESATEFAVDRSAVDAIMNGYSALMRGTRVLPVQKDGRVTGARLVGVQPGTLLDQLGLKSGDELQTINGFSLTSPEQALTAYAKLRTSSGIRLQIVRSGKPMSVEYKIQ